MDKKTNVSPNAKVADDIRKISGQELDEYFRKGKDVDQKEKENIKHKK